MDLQSNLFKSNEHTYALVWYLFPVNEAATLRKCRELSSFVDLDRAVSLFVNVQTPSLRTESYR